MVFPNAKKVQKQPGSVFKSPAVCINQDILPPQMDLIAAATWLRVTVPSSRSWQSSSGPLLFWLISACQDR